MKNFPFKYHGQDYWYSRSIVCSNFVYCSYNGVWHILAAKRGNNQTSPGLWNSPGGFLDHDETVTQCAIRETLEETGVNVSNPVLYCINSHKFSGKQHVVLVFYTNIGKVNQLPDLSDKYNEPGETIDIKWIPVKDVDNYNWLNEHKSYIKFIFKENIFHRSSLKITNNNPILLHDYKKEV